MDTLEILVLFHKIIDFAHILSENQKFYNFIAKYM
jgi:hypothetical protein